MRKVTLPRLIVAASLGVVAAATLQSSPDTDTTGWSTCLFCGELGIADAIRNVLLFTPLGMGLALMGLRPWITVLSAALLSISIELTQLFIQGRDANVGDILSNTLGCAIGMLLVITSRSWLYPSRRLASRLSLVAGVAVAGLVFLTGFLLQASFPNTTYYGHWTPNLGHLECIAVGYSSHRLDPGS